ncbi:MAG: ATP-dependent Clp protease ATP-binding subunit [Bacteroidales bacterium]|nr:ATP-dependent Clp protease ATP-binding subunit [Bacteroidales bacterium]
MSKWNFSENLIKILQNSALQAQKYHSPTIGVEHIFLSMLEGNYPSIENFFAYKGINTKYLAESIGSKIYIHDDDYVPNIESSHIPLIKQSTNLLDIAAVKAKSANAAQIEVEHLLMAIVWQDFNIPKVILNDNGISYNDIYNYFKDFADSSLQSSDDISVRNQHDDDEYPDDEEVNDLPRRTERNRAKGAGIKKKKSSTPNLDAYGRDLNKAAEEGRLDPVVGREKELERIAQVLSRRKKNNPILIGEPGVGKSAIAEGLALKILQKQVPRILLNKRIIALDIASMLAGTKYRGQFEERMKNLLWEVESNPDIILFIDEIHTIVGAGNASGALDASNMFKPALARGELQCIGATTLDEYRNSIESDGALERRFQKILVEPTSPEETIQILNNIKSKYEDHHMVHYTDEAIHACVYLTQRYITDRCLPDKAIDALDEAGARVHINNIVIPDNITNLEKQIEALDEDKRLAIEQQRYEEAGRIRDNINTLQKQLEQSKKEWDESLNLIREEVTEETIADVIAMITGIPVNRINSNTTNRLQNMEDELKNTIIGQDDAVKTICKAIRRNKVGLKDPSRPIGTFLFVGPTGVGKTFLCKILAKYLFDSEDAIVRIDMSEYMEKFSITRLIGAPPGYVGYEEGGGQLTEKIRRKPYSIVLLDEIEKAHPDVFNLLLQVFDEGHLTDSLGRKVDFKNTIIIMTSNVGSRQLKDFGQGVGFTTNARQENYKKDIQRTIEDAISKQFAPEFINRIDDIIFFNSLSKEDIYKIIDVELKHLYQKLNDINIQISLSEPIKDFIADKGWSSQYGARPLKRAIQQYIEDVLAEEIVNESIHNGDSLLIDYNSQEEKVIVTHQEPKI